MINQVKKNTSAQEGECTRQPYVYVEVSYDYIIQRMHVLF